MLNQGMQLVRRHTFTLHCPDGHVRGMTAWSSKVEQRPGSVKSPPFPPHQPARGPSVVSTESLELNLYKSTR